jgi:hypothetical protein
MIERYGQSKFLMDSGATDIHRDDFGVLYRKEIQGDEPMVMVKVANSTAEHDGTFRDYFIRVHPECRLLLGPGKFGASQPMTAHSAIASTFGLTAAEYAPCLET